MPQHVPPRIYRRVPFDTAVRLKFDRFHGFVEQYCGNLSLGGMFINSDEPPPLGTEVAVEFQLEDGFELIRGRGRVAWVREPGDGGEPPGYGLRFLELTPGSRELIFRLVERRVREGDRVFDLEDGAPATAVGRLVHDEEHALLLDEPGAAPPWDRPAPRPGEAAAGGGTAAAAGGEVVRYGRAAREAAEAEAAGPPPAPVEAGLGEAPDEAVGGEPARDEDPEASFAGLVDDDEETRDAEAAPGGDDGADGATGGDEPWGPSTAAGAALSPAAGSDQAGAAAAAGLPAGGTGEAWPARQWRREPTAAPAAPGEDAGTAAASEPTAGAEPAGPPVRPRRGPRVAVAIVAGIAVLALAGFLLLRARDAGAPAGRAAGEQLAAPAATAAEDGSGAAAPAETDGAVTEHAAAPSAPGDADGAAEPAGAASAAGPGTIERIAWQRRDGGVDFEIAGGGPIAPALVDHFNVGGERPRLVVRIAGVERPYSRGALAVGGPLVERVRTGFHPAAAGSASSLHVVFDLAAPAAAAAVDTAGGRVRVRFEER